MLLPVLLLACSSGGGPSRQAPEPQGDSFLSRESGSQDSLPQTFDGELRGIWVTRWTYDSPEKVEKILDNIAAAGFNAVFFQVRGSFDAFYASSLEPWAAELSGTLGTNPGWDPLETAVEMAHARGLQLHAYLNVFPLSSGTEAPAHAEPEHAYHAHPEWRAADANGTAMTAGSADAISLKYVFSSPGHPGVRARVAEVALDITSRYAVDGIHLDYVRYPGQDYSHDPTSESLYDSSLSWADWQREQVKATVAGVSQAVDVPVTAAVWGIYENQWGWSSVSEGNLDYYQDSFAFLNEGLTDANIPMIYWPVTDNPGDRLDFRTLARDHLDHASGRHVYPGISAMPSGEDDLQRIVDCIEASRALGAPGFVVFDYTTALDHFGALVDGPLAETVSPPSMNWRE